MLMFLMLIMDATMHSRIRMRLRLRFARVLNVAPQDGWGQPPVVPRVRIRVQCFNWQRQSRRRSISSLRQLLQLLPSSIDEIALFSSQSERGRRGEGGRSKYLPVRHPEARSSRLVFLGFMPRWKAGCRSSLPPLAH
jgi:hypothetical protein